MKFLKEFSNWNPKLNKQVLDFIEQNKKADDLADTFNMCIQEYSIKKSKNEK